MRNFIWMSFARLPQIDGDRSQRSISGIDVDWPPVKTARNDAEWDRCACDNRRKAREQHMVLVFWVCQTPVIKNDNIIHVAGKRIWNCDFLYDADAGLPHRRRVMQVSSRSVFLGRRDAKRTSRANVNQVSWPYFDHRHEPQRKRDMHSFGFAVGSYFLSKKQQNLHSLFPKSGAGFRGSWILIPEKQTG